MTVEDLKEGVVAALASRDAYMAARPQVFPSEAALEWFIRQNRNALIAGGAIVLVRQRWLINAHAFDAHVLKVGAEAAAKKVQG